MSISVLSVDFMPAEGLLGVQVYLEAGVTGFFLVMCQFWCHAKGRLCFPIVSASFLHMVGVALILPVYCCVALVVVCRVVWLMESWGYGLVSQWCSTFLSS